MVTPHTPDGKKIGNEGQAPLAEPQQEPMSESVQAKTGAVQARVEGVLEGVQPESLFTERFRHIEMLLDQGEMFANEAVVELADLLNLNDLPITKQLLRRLGIKKFTLTHEDFEKLPVIGLISKQQKQWMIIEDSYIPDDFGLPFDVEEDVGDELWGILVYDEAKGFGFHIPNHLSKYPFYPLDAAALAALDEHGGASAFINKAIVVHVDVGDTLHMHVLAPEVY